LNRTLGVDEDRQKRDEETVLSEAAEDLLVLQGASGNLALLLPRAPQVVGRHSAEPA
jgi:hypothetical protein